MILLSSSLISSRNTSSRTNVLNQQRIYGKHSDVSINNLSYFDIDICINVTSPIIFFSMEKLLYDL